VRLNSTGPANDGQTLPALSGPASCPVSVLSQGRLTELLFPRGIRRSKQRAELKLFAEYLWLRAGCCHRVVDFHPNECFPIGFIDPRTSEKLLAEITNPNIGWAQELDGRRGRRRPVIVTQHVWEVASGDVRQGKLFKVPADIPPEAIGRDPRLVMPHLLPLALFEDEAVDPAHKLVGWFLMLETGLRSWEVAYHVATVAGELGKHPKQIRDSIKRLDGAYWQTADCSSGYGRLRFLPAIYLPHQEEETRLVANGQPSVAAGYLPVFDGQGAHGAPETGASWAHGAPDGWAHGAHGAPISGASLAHGAPVEAAHGAPQMGASLAHGAPDGWAHGAHGAPILGASLAHGAPVSGVILSVSESNLITSDKMVVERIERRAREVIRRLKTCEGMAAFMPILFAVLVELGELDEKTLWENIERANRKDGPPGYLTATVKRQVAPEHTTEAYAREVFPRLGIVWSNERRGQVAKPRRARTQTEADEMEARRQRIILDGKANGKTPAEINRELSAEGLEDWGCNR